MWGLKGPFSRSWSSSATSLDHFLVHLSRAHWDEDLGTKFTFVLLVHVKGFLDASKAKKMATWVSMVIITMGSWKATNSAWFSTFNIVILLVELNNVPRSFSWWNLLVNPFHLIVPFVCFKLVVVLFSGFFFILFMNFGEFVLKSGGFGDIFLYVHISDAFTSKLRK